MTIMSVFLFAYFAYQNQKFVITFMGYLIVNYFYYYQFVGKIKANHMQQKRIPDYICYLLFVHLLTFVCNSWTCTGSPFM